MAILYNYTAGSPPNPFMGTLCIVVAFIALLLSIGALLEGERSLGFIALLVVAVMILFSILSFRDTREERVKATIDDSASWKEIRDQYELLDVEGSIYTFRVIEKEEN